MGNTKPVSDIEFTLSFLSDLKQIETSTDLTRSIKKRTERYGVENILAGFIPRPGMLPNEQMKHILLADWPETWATIYFQNGFLFDDPTIRQVKQVQPTFAWSDIARDTSLSRRERLIMDQAKDFQLNEGCTVPLVSLDGRQIGFSFAGDKIDNSPEAKGALTLIASFALGRTFEIRNKHLRLNAHLTPREREVIQWIAAGKTDWEVSIILGVSQKAIAKHVYNVRRKLGAMNRTHAIAEALRAGLIQ